MIASETPPTMPDGSQTFVVCLCKAQHIEDTNVMSIFFFFQFSYLQMESVN